MKADEDIVKAIKLIGKLKELIIVVVILLAGLTAGSLIEDTQKSNHKLWLEHQNLP